MMLASNVPPFRANHVGSLVRPPAIMEARARVGISADELRRVEDEAIREAVKLQEEIGFKVVTDGEFRRKLWTDFLGKLENVSSAAGQMDVRFHTQQNVLDLEIGQYRIADKLGHPKPLLVNDFKFLKSATRVTPKVTIPAPTLLHFRGGRNAVDPQAYPDMAEFFADVARVYQQEITDLAGAGCRYLQIDEVDFAFLCDPKIRGEVRKLGENPETLPHTYARLINESISTRPADMMIGMHLCRGNYKGGWLAEGGYEPVAEILFNALDVGAYFLEYDSARAGDFKPLRFVPPGRLVVLGLLTTKSSKMENKDGLKRRIDEAARYVPLDQIGLSPQCGFASNSEGSVVTLEDQIAKLRLVVDVAREVWGSA
jgi:methionine synthase II (cobalamin-independent)